MPMDCSWKMANGKWTLAPGVSPSPRYKHATIACYRRCTQEDEERMVKQLSQFWTRLLAHVWLDWHVTVTSLRNSMNCQTEDSSLELTRHGRHAVIKYVGVVEANCEERFELVMSMDGATSEGTRAQKHHFY